MTTFLRSRALWVVGAVVVLALAITGALLLSSPSSACGCAIPPSSDAAVETAQAYVAAVATDPESMLDDGAEPPTDEQAAALAALDDPTTTWVVVRTVRHGDDYGESPAERLVVGVLPDGSWAPLVVHTATDYATGTVSLVPVTDMDLDVSRSGEYPLLGDTTTTALTGWATPTLVSLTDGPLEMERLENGTAWAYVGSEPLTQDRYLVLGADVKDDTIIAASSAWYVPTDAPTIAGD